MPPQGRMAAMRTPRNDGGHGESTGGEVAVGTPQLRVSAQVPQPQCNNPPRSWIPTSSSAQPGPVWPSWALGPWGSVYGTGGHSGEQLGKRRRREEPHPHPPAPRMSPSWEPGSSPTKCHQLRVIPRVAPAIPGPRSWGGCWGWVRVEELEPVPNPMGPISNPMGPIPNPIESISNPMESIPCTSITAPPHQPTSGLGTAPCGGVTPRVTSSGTPQLPPAWAGLDAGAPAMECHWERGRCRPEQRRSPGSILTLWGEEEEEGDTRCHRLCPRQKVPMASP